MSIKQKNLDKIFKNYSFGEEKKDSGSCSSISVKDSKLISRDSLPKINSNDNILNSNSHQSGPIAKFNPFKKNPRYHPNSN
jgi:hypothetical protein